MTDSDKRQENVIAAGGPSREITFLRVSPDATFSLDLPFGSVVDLWPWNEEFGHRQGVLVRLYGASGRSACGLVHEQPTDTEYRISLDPNFDRVSDRAVYFYIAQDLPEVTFRVPKGVTLRDNR